MTENSALIVQDRQAPESIIRAVLDSVNSPHIRRAYERALNDFMTWYHAHVPQELNKATV